MPKSLNPRQSRPGPGNRGPLDAEDTLNQNTKVIAENSDRWSRCSGGGPYGEVNCVLTDKTLKAEYGESIEPTYKLVKSGNFVIYD